jgi:hypothetical protein
MATDFPRSSSSCVPDVGDAGLRRPNLRRFQVNKLYGGSTSAMIAVGVVLSWSAIAGQDSATSTRRYGQLAGCSEEPAEFHRCAAAKEKSFNPPRTPDGVVDLRGMWERAGVSSNNIEEHPPGDDRGGKSMIVDPADGRIPYQPWAIVQRTKNFEKYMAPLAECLLPGVPRQIDTPGGYQIIQRPGYVAFVHEWDHMYRVIQMDGRPHISGNIRLWMGDSRGRWEGNTLVVDVTNLNGRTWFDDMGNFYSDALHVVERFTLVDADSIHYEAIIEDPNVYTRSWTIAFGIRRTKQPGYELIEEACHEGNRDPEQFRSLGYQTFPGVLPPK